MEQIRENMFFVVTGVVVVLCLVFYFNPVFSVRSWETANEELFGKVQKLETQLGKWAKVGSFVPNESALAAVEIYQNNYVSMFDGRKDKDGHIVAVGVKDKFTRIVLPDRIPGLKLADKDRAEVFLMVYRDLIKAVKQETRDNGIRFDSGTWAFWDWGQKLPDLKAQRQAATLEYFLTTEILDVIQQKTLNVKSLDLLEIDPGTDKNEDSVPGSIVRQRKGDYFDVIPFVLELKMQFQKYPRLLAKLLTTRTPIFIERVSIGRLNDEERANFRSRPPQAVIVKVKLRGLALNYREKVKPAAGATR